jgi:CheY-like chemotaxis protein
MALSTITRIRKNKATKNIPIIALTASAEVSLMEKAVALGANKCLTEPFNIQELHIAITEMLAEQYRKR